MTQLNPDSINPDAVYYKHPGDQCDYTGPKGRNLTSHTGINRGCRVNPCAECCFVGETVEYMEIHRDHDHLEDTADPLHNRKDQSINATEMTFAPPEISLEYPGGIEGDVDTGGMEGGLESLEENVEEMEMLAVCLKVEIKEENKDSPATDLESGKMLFILFALPLSEFIFGFPELVFIP